MRGAPETPFEYETCTVMGDLEYVSDLRAVTDDVAVQQRTVDDSERRGRLDGFFRIGAVQPVYADVVRWQRVQLVLALLFLVVVLVVFFVIGHPRSSVDKSDLVRLTDQADDVVREYVGMVNQCWRIHRCRRRCRRSSSSTVGRSRSSS